MTATRIAGHLLLWMGFLAGAFVAVRSTEVSQAPWATISWPAYGAAMFVAVVGVVVLRITRRPIAVTADEKTGAINELAAILTRLHGTVERWSTDAEKIGVYDFHGMIDEELVDDLGRFAELRETLVAEFDLDRYAKIMTEFALAERTINRTWSASADGYVDEVRVSLHRAAAHLSAARQRLDEALEGLGDPARNDNELGDLR